jgi:quercetin dioxygenase-like cupin family protein
MINRLIPIAAALCVLAGDQALAQGAMTPFMAAPFAQDADVACLQSAVETGNAAKGPFTLIVKATAGCVVPWHSHTAQEQLMVVVGEVMAEMSDHPPTQLGPGGFAVMGGRMAHQFTCKGRAACVMFITFGGPYDIKWGK